MSTDNLLNYYSSLFSIEIAVFGIISAVILVFIQLVYSNYSYRHIHHILKNPFLILFYVFCVIDLILTSIGSYFLTIGLPNVFPNLNISTQAIITNPYYVLVCLVLIFISISFFVILIVKNITYLQPHRAIFLLSNSIHYKNMRDFLWKKYEPDPPFNMWVNVVRYDDGDEDRKETEEELIARLKEGDEKRQKELDAITKQIETIKKKTANAEDPLLPIRDMMIHFVRKSDLSSLSEATDLLLSVSNKFVSDIPKSGSDSWQPESDLPLSFTKHLIETLITLMEVAEKEGLESAKKEIMGVSSRYALHLLEPDYSQEIDKVTGFWQKNADMAIGRSSMIFQQIMGFYLELGEKVFDSIKEKSTDSQEALRLEVLNEIFRNVGWLGERLLVKLPMEDSPLMRNYDYSTEYDALFNCLLSFRYIYNHKHPKLYPLIYFDALYVVLRKLVGIYKKQKDKSLAENIFDIAYAFSSFAESAIQAENASGAALATMRLREAYQELKEENLNKEANEVIKQLIGVGIMAAAYEHKLERVEFMPEPLHEWIIDKLVDSREDIADEVKDKYIHSAIETKANHDAAWGFITKLGMRMGTNFGFMFEPSTGELYPEDDPRRR